MLRCRSSAGFVTNNEDTKLFVYYQNPGTQDGER